MTIRLKGIDRQWTIVVHMRVKRQHQRWTLPYDPHASVAMTMDPAFVAFGTCEPTLQVHIVGWKLSRLTPHKQPRFKAAHHLGKMLLNGSRTGLPLLLQRDELRRTDKVALGLLEEQPADPTGRGHGGSAIRLVPGVENVAGARGADLLGFGGPPVSEAEWHFLAELTAAFDR